MHNQIEEKTEHDIKTAQGLVHKMKEGERVIYLSDMEKKLGPTMLAYITSEFGYEYQKNLIVRRHTRKDILEDIDTQKERIKDAQKQLKIAQNTIKDANLILNDLNEKLSNATE